MGRLLDRALELQASDLVFTCYENDVEVLVRRIGIVKRLASMPRELGLRCMTYIRAMAGLRLAEHRHPQDGRWIYRLARTRPST